VVRQVDSRAPSGCSARAAHALAGDWHLTLGDVSVRRDGGSTGFAVITKSGQRSTVDPTADAATNTTFSTLGKPDICTLGLQAEVALRTLCRHSGL
jgi:hypothetical protein